MSSRIGGTVRRKEDARLVTGRGNYSDDLNLPGQAYGAALRSPHAHARIRSIDIAAARAMPGVLAVLTGADALADGLKRIPHLAAPGTPPDIVATLQKQIAAIIVLPDVKATIEKLSFQPLGSSPAEFSAAIKNDIAVWGKVMKDANIPVN